MTKLKLTITSNTGVLLEKEVTMVVVPGMSGDIGITSSERTFVYLLKPGIIYLFEDHGVSSRYFVFNGRFISQDNKLVIITESQLVDLSNINKEEILNKISDNESLLKNTTDKNLAKVYQQNIENYQQALASEHVKNY